MIKYEIKEHIGTLGRGIEVRKVIWGDNPVKYDLRNWYKDKATGEEKPGKGISLNVEEIKKLKNLLNGIDIS